MTTLTQEAIAEFQRLCFKIHGVTLTVEQAEEAGERVIRVTELLMQPTPSQVRRRKLVETMKQPETRVQLALLKRDAVRGQR